MPTSMGIVSGSTDMVMAPREAGQLVGFSLCNLSASVERSPIVIVRRDGADDVHLLDEAALQPATSLLYTPPGAAFDLARDDYVVVFLPAPVSPGISWVCNWR